MSQIIFPHKILWLASYPKSGNTWFRAFLTALVNGGKVDINQLASDGIFSSRETFDLVSDIDSRDLYDSEAKLMVADVYRYFAESKESLGVVKIHDFFGPDPKGDNLVPDDVTHCALYFIRNPLDIAASLANHLHSTIDEAVSMINNPNAHLSNQKNNLNRNSQFKQFISDWSNHVDSWTAKPSFPVYVVRYEDMLTDTFATFSKAVKFVGWQYNDDQISKALAATSFEMLSSQEKEKGFKEKSNVSGKFFRSGKMGNWENELTAQQISSIKGVHKATLYKYQYLRTDEKL